MKLVNGFEAFELIDKILVVCDCVVSDRGCHLLADR